MLYRKAYNQYRPGGDGVEPVQIAGVPAVWKGSLLPTMLHMLLSFSVISLFDEYELVLSEQTQDTLQLRVSLSDLL